MSAGGAHISVFCFLMSPKLCQYIGGNINITIFLIICLFHCMDYNRELREKWHSDFKKLICVAYWSAFPLLGHIT